MQSIARNFIHKKQVSDTTTDVAGILKMRRKKGEIGIEIEVEGKNLPQGPGSPWDSSYNNHLIPKQWEYHHDGSLRGEMNAEYVLRKPLKFSEVPKALDDLWEMFTESNSVLDESNRTSVHIHLNAQEFYLDRLCSFFALYFSVEEVLTSWCGEHRVGNMFCLQARDAHRIVTQIRDFLRGNGRVTIPKQFHYSGVNIHALVKHGSLEIRSLRGATNKDVILRWVRILERIYKLSADFSDPRDIPQSFSGGGHVAFVKMVLGDEADSVLAECGMNYHEVQEACLNGIRVAQDLCFCRDWSKYQKLDAKDLAPFVRPEDLSAPVSPGLSPAPSLSWFASSSSSDLQQLNDVYLQNASTYLQTIEELIEEEGNN